MKLQLQHMISLQDAMNTRAIGENWTEYRHNWYRAIWIEAGEMLDHYGWKWWKHQTCDIEQVQLELVDIWHFMLSAMIESNISLDLIYEDLEDVWLSNGNAPLSEERTRQHIESIAHWALKKSLPLSHFGQVCKSVNLSFEDLYRQYVSKNVLNIFRQDNGYKDGTYRKEWSDGREDNQHLVDVMSETYDLSGETLEAEILARLTNRYNQ